MKTVLYRKIKRKRKRQKYVGRIYKNINSGNEYLYITHSCGTNNGDSGGPLVNFYAEVVGINQSIQFNEYLSRLTGSAQKADGIAYAVDAVTIRRLLKENNIEYDK